MVDKNQIIIEDHMTGLFSKFYWNDLNDIEREILNEMLDDATYAAACDLYLETLLEEKD